MDEVLLYILNELKENCILYTHDDGTFSLVIDHVGPDGHICYLTEYQYNLLKDNGWKVYT